jgi:hypothetical protein
MNASQIPTEAQNGPWHIKNQKTEPTYTIQKERLLGDQWKASALGLW